MPRDQALEAAPRLSGTAKSTGRTRSGSQVAGSANVDFNRHKSCPAYSDTDRGGVWDGSEVKAHSDPTNVLSTPSNPGAWPGPRRAAEHR
jgi:hypothetical protein